jgi:hypothetical protein
LEPLLREIGSKGSCKERLKMKEYEMHRQAPAYTETVDTAQGVAYSQPTDLSSHLEMKCI